MYIKNRRNSSKIKASGSNQSLCLTESFVLRNRLLFIYKTVVFHCGTHSKPKKLSLIFEFFFWILRKKKQKNHIAEF